MVFPRAFEKLFQLLSVTGPASCLLWCTKFWSLNCAREQSNRFSQVLWRLSSGSSTRKAEVWLLKHQFSQPQGFRCVCVSSWRSAAAHWVKKGETEWNRGKKCGDASCNHSDITTNHGITVAKPTGRGLILHNTFSVPDPSVKSAKCPTARSQWKWKSRRWKSRRTSWNMRISVQSDLAILGYSWYMLVCSHPTCPQVPTSRAASGCWRSTTKLGFDRICTWLHRAVAGQSLGSEWS